MLYRYFERRHGLSHEVDARVLRVVRTLTWVRNVYILISAVVLGFALVHRELFLSFAALTFLASSFALKKVGQKLERSEM